MQCLKKPGSISALKWAIVAAIIFGAFQLPFSSFMADDLMLMGVLAGVSPHTWLGPMEVYTLADGNPEHMRISKDTGAFQWFWNPKFKAKFFRPLSSSLLILDHEIFGLNPLGYNIHSILWFISLIIAAGFLMQRALPGRISGLAIIIFAISGIHWYVVYWTAARHIIVAASIGLWSILAYSRWREQGWKKGYIISLLGMILAFLASEASLGILAYLFLYELISTHDPLKQKLKNLLPFIITVIAYLVFYKSFGYGAYWGAGYLNPLTEPLQYLFALPIRLLALAGSMIAGGNTELWMIPSIRFFIILIGVLIILLLIILLRKAIPYASSKEKKSARWMLLGSVISLLPFSAAPPGARSLVIAFIGGSVIISFALYYWWNALRKLGGFKVKVLSIFCWLLLFIHFVLAPLQRFAGPVIAKKIFHDRLESVLEQAEFNDKALPQKLVILAVPDFSLGLHPFYYRKLKREPMPESWWVLSWENCAHRVYRSGSNTFELELINGSINIPFLKKGTIIKLTGMEVTVLKADKQGAKCIEFRFDRSLNDASLKFLAWSKGRLRNIQMPPLGKSILLPAKDQVIETTFH